MATNQTKRITRRNFLERTSTAAGALAVPYLIPRNVLASEEGLGANDRIGIAGIGIGRQGSGRFLAAANSKLGRPIAVADANMKTADPKTSRAFMTNNLSSNRFQ